jgi:Amt family ammonium transporter
VKNALKYDDSLDAFGIHAVGGIVGAIATGILVNPAFGGAGLVDFTKAAAAEYNMGVQVMAQVKAVGVAVVWSAIASTIVFVLIKFTFGLRVNAETEEDGLDIAEHGERAYH